MGTNVWMSNKKSFTERQKRSQKLWSQKWVDRSLLCDQVWFEFFFLSILCVKMILWNSVNSRREVFKRLIFTQKSIQKTVNSHYVKVNRQSFKYFSVWQSFEEREREKERERDKVVYWKTKGKIKNVLQWQSFEYLSVWILKPIFCSLCEYSQLTYSKDAYSHYSKTTFSNSVREYLHSVSLLCVNKPVLNGANKSFLNENTSTDAKAPNFTRTCVLYDRFTQHLERKRK